MLWKEQDVDELLESMMNNPFQPRPGQDPSVADLIAGVRIGLTQL